MIKLKEPLYQQYLMNTGRKQHLQERMHVQARPVSQMRIHSVGAHNLRRIIKVKPMS